MSEGRRNSGSRDAAPQPIANVPVVNVRIATSKQLQALPRVGPVLASAIIKGRPYGTVEDLMRVPGIKEKMLETLRPNIKVN